MFSTFFQVLQIIYFVLSTMYGLQFCSLFYPNLAKMLDFCESKKPGGPFLTLAGILTQANGFFPAAATLFTSNSFSQLLGLAELPKIFQNTSALTWKTSKEGLNLVFELYF